MSAFRSVLGLSVVVIAAGCGGSTGSVSPADGGSSSGSSSGSGSGSSSGSGSGTGSGAEGDDATVSGDDSGLPTTVDDAGNIVPPGDDASTTTNPDRDGGPGVTTPPKGTDGGAMQTACNGKACDSATQVCCVTRTGEACSTPAACMGDSLACSGSNSCATGDVCCEEAVRGGGVTSKCEKTCPMGSIQLCTTNDDCAADEICRKLGTTFSTCERAPTPPPVRDGGPVVGPGPVILDAGKP